MQNFQPRNYRIDNVELNYAKLDAPVSPFGTPQYELQIATTDKTVADEWKANHLPVKLDVDRETILKSFLDRRWISWDLRRQTRQPQPT